MVQEFNVVGIRSCSTPFGINEGITKITSASLPRSISSAQRLSASTKESHYSRHRLFRPWLGAQRLSASTKESRKRCFVSNRIELCSTPFGINEGITDGRCVRWCFDVGVLNAFRHQRRNHIARSARSKKSRYRAQRLSASTKESRGASSDA